jgi:FG-GAP-like repeat
MFFSRSLRSADGKSRASRRRRAARHAVVKCWLGLEGLEERTVPAFLAPVSLAGSASIVAAAVGDFNGDGFKDIVTVGEVSGRGVVTVELNHGDGTYTAGPSADTGNSPVSVEVGDFNGDGKLDVVTIAQYYTGGVTVIKGNGDGSFQPYTSYTVQIPPTSIEVADVNGDGHPDLVASNHYFNTTDIFLNDGTGTFGPKNSFTAGGAPTSVAIADMNGDGKVDVVSTNQTQAGTISVQLGNGDGTFGAATNTPAFAAPMAETLGDFNGDGKSDVAVANSGTPNFISVLLGNGDGTFQPVTSYNIGNMPLDIEQGDVNADGKIDLLERTGFGFAVELGNGDGTFSPAVTIVSPGGAAMVAADLNNDGALDVATASSAGTVSVMMNDNSGLVGTVTSGSFALTTSTTSVAAGATVPLTVSVLDDAGNVNPAFLGTVSIVSTDPRATSITYQFTTADAGTHTFPAGMKLFTAGSQSIMASAPFIGTGTQVVTVAIGAAAQLGVTTVPATVAGDPLSVRVISLDAFGNMGAAYTGTVHFTSTDAQAVLPVDYAFTAADAGIHTFTSALKTAGLVRITAADTSSSTFIGTSQPITVTSAAAASLSIVGGGGSIGVFRPVTIVARDIYGNVATTDNGLVHLSSSDPATVLPADFALTGGNGVASVKLLTEGAQTLTSNDVANPALTASEVVTGTPATAGMFVVTGYPSSVAGVAQAFTVQVIDILGKVATKYTHMVYFSSSDFQAGLPLSYTFTAADAGVHTFTATLKTAGSRSITVSDPIDGAFGSQTGVVIIPAAATTISVSAPVGATAGVAVAATVTARDPFGNIAAGYTGTVHFTSTDAQAALPVNYTFTAADAGVHTFAITLKTANVASVLQTVTVTDQTNAALKAVMSSDVTNNVATQIVLTAPTNLTAGTAFTLKLSIVDAYGNKVKNYSGKVHFSDSLTALGLPADYTFTAADAGIHSFNLTLGTAGSQTLTVVDPANSLLLGTVVVNPKAAGGGGGGTGGGGGGTGGGGTGGGGKVIV